MDLRTPGYLMAWAPGHARTRVIGLVNGHQKPPHDAWIFLDAVEDAVRRSRVDF